MIDRRRDYGWQKFEWDDDKARSNLAKHGVAFEEATTVFADSFAITFVDERHSREELREIIIGHSQFGQLLLVSFSERLGAVRIISARKATRNERRTYEQRFA
jgi:uncharacterized DUF497 family protein